MISAPQKCNYLRKMTDWKLGQYVRVWKNEGYEYGHIETLPTSVLLGWAVSNIDDEVMLVGDDGKEIYAQVKDLEEG